MYENNFTTKKKLITVVALMAGERGPHEKVAAGHEKFTAWQERVGPRGGRKMTGLTLESFPHGGRQWPAWRRESRPHDGRK